MTAEALGVELVSALDTMKAMDIRSLDVRGLTSITDFMIIASGRSDRQVRALAQKALECARQFKVPVLGTEGEREGEWVLIDLGDVIVHLMHPETRAYYQLEKLWSVGDRRASKAP
ncbi:MAG: ribosome silencing factor [Gammaproteobacteria bacterium]|nr:ribosome silencing factor [Gammaproteobacteria bacterium]